MKSKNSIYFDNAATTLIKPREVAEAVYHAIYSGEFANPSRGFYETSLNSLNLLIEARSEIAKLFKVSVDEIVFTENITAALNISMRAYLDGGHVITTVNEHNSVLRPLNELCDDISYVNMREGILNYSEFKKLLKKNTEAVVISHASNVSGIVTDMDFIYDFCLENGLFLIVDGAQSAGCIEVDLNRKLPEMVYCFTGHKSLYGPQGTGGMIILTNKKPRQVFSGGSGTHSFDLKQPENVPEIFETGTRNIHSIAGLKKGVEYINKKGISNIEKELSEKLNYLTEGLLKFKKLKFYHNLNCKKTPIISFNADVPSEEFSEYLAKNKIMTRAGFHCAPLHHKSCGTEKIGMVRMSLSTFNTYDEIDEVLKILSEKLV